MRGSIYELEFVDTEFRAAGMHDALVIEKALREAVRETLEALPQVESIDHGPWIRMKASPKNFKVSASEMTDELLAGKCRRIFELRDSKHTIEETAEFLDLFVDEVLELLEEAEERGLIERDS